MILECIFYILILNYLLFTKLPAMVVILTGVTMIISPSIYPTMI